MSMSVSYVEEEAVYEYTIKTFNKSSRQVWTTPQNQVDLLVNEIIEFLKNGTENPTVDFNRMNAGKSLSKRYRKHSF